MVVDDILAAMNGYSKRGLRLVAMLVDMHIDIAQREATREQRRITKASVLVGIGVTLITTGFVLIQVLLVLLALSAGQNWLLVILGLIGFDLLVGGFLAAVGAKKLRGPYMPETVGQLSRTTAILTRDDAP